MTEKTVMLQRFFLRRKQSEPDPQLCIKSRGHTHLGRSPAPSSLLGLGLCSCVGSLTWFVLKGPRRLLGELSPGRDRWRGQG